MLAGQVVPDAGSIEVGRADGRPHAAGDRGLSLQTPLEHVLTASAGRRRRGGLGASLFSTPQMRGEDAAFVAWGEEVLGRFGLPRDTRRASCR